MRESFKKRIIMIIDNIKCPKDFKCYESEFKDLCKAKDIGMDSFLKCVDNEKNVCVFSISFGSSNYCRCPLRVYIAKELKK